MPPYSTLPRQHLTQLRRLLERDYHLLLSENLTERLDNILKPLSFTEPTTGDGWKGKIALSRTELERQARLIDDLFCRGSVAMALGFMREWTISWITWATGEKSRWLKKEVRKNAGGILYAIRGIGADYQLKPSPRLSSGAV